MPCQLSNHSDVDLSSLEPHVQGMYDFFDQKIGFKKPPTMHFDSEPNNQSNVLGKTAYYDPSSLEIHVFTDGRHPKDMLRSIAHELIHHQQNLEDRLDVGGYMGQGYYLQNEAMKELEQEAMLKGNALMREYEDTTKSEEMNKMSLKEWKNNELNKLLLEKFGILKEGQSSRGETKDRDVGRDRMSADRMHEEEELEEEKKPDFLDLDKDGDKEESMEDAAKDKEMNEEVIEEELNEEAKETATDKMYRKALERGIEKGKKQAAERKKKEAEAEKAKKESPLQEALNKILKAKSITLKSSGKKIK